MSKLLKRWRWEMRTANVAHLRTTDIYGWRNFTLGGLAAVFGAVVGAGVFASLQGSQVPVWVRIAAGAVALTAAGLAALRAYLEYGSRAEKHCSASREYGNLVREIDNILQLGSKALSATTMAAIRNKADQVDLKAPNVPPAIWAWAVAGVEKEIAKETTDATTVGRGLQSRTERLWDRLAQ